MDELFQLLSLISRLLHKAGIPYMLTGSMAMTLYAQPRMTRDLDLIIELPPGSELDFVNLFQDECYVSIESVLRAVECQGMFNIIHKSTLAKADFIIRKATPFRLLEFKRRRRMTIHGAEVDVVSPEDLILSKLDWARDSMSETQLRDVKNLLTLAPDLDLDYIQVWVDKLKVREVFDKARSR